MPTAYDVVRKTTPNWGYNGPNAVKNAKDVALEAIVQAPDIINAVEKNGSTAANRLGQAMHKTYKLGAKGIKEFSLKSGKRIDFLDIENGTIYELKKNNKREISRGKKQLEVYLKELNSMPRFRGIEWNTVLDTY